MSAHMETPKAATTDEMIDTFNAMVPSKNALMVIEIEMMFPSIIGALKRNVSEKQIIDLLRKRWPDTHVATVTKLLNAERERRQQQGEHIECKPFGSTRKPKIRMATVTGEICGSVRMPQAAPDATDGDQHEVSA